MTTNDTKPFRSLMATLCVTYQLEFDEVQSRFYWDALKDLELVDLQQAAVRVAQGSKWFPKPSELRTALVQVRRDIRAKQDADLLAMPAHLADHCETCRDTGWETHPDGVRACLCRATNPVYQRKLVAGRVGQEPPPASAGEAPHAIRAVEDFKRLSSGEKVGQRPPVNSQEPL